MDGIDWDAEAVRLANYIARRIVDLNRGALLWHQGIIVAFGTDHYTTDAKSQEVVQLLTQIVEIPAWKTDRLAFGTNDEEQAGSTWVLLLDPCAFERCRRPGRVARHGHLGGLGPCQRPAHRRVPVTMTDA